MAEQEFEKKLNGNGDGENHSSGNAENVTGGKGAAQELPPPTDAALQMEEIQKQVEQYKDLLLRKAAEFDNFKRRIENETSNVIRFASEALIGDLLPVLDDFERSLKHSREAGDAEVIAKGIELIYQKLVKVLEGRGLKSFETVGKEFNVDYHDALMQLPRADVPPHTVVQEIDKGYTLNDKVIRHAKVIVSSAPEEVQSGAGGNEAAGTKAGE